MHDNTAETYTYDTNGNIRTKTLYSNAQVDDLEHATVVDTINYAYGDSSWSDKLTAYDGQTITYDAIGNPTSYKGAALTWQGRLLMSYAKDDERYDYTYDADGLRTSKKKYVNNVLSFTENYVWVNDKIVAVKRVNSDNSSIIVRYLYDANDELFGFVYNDKTYFYIKNPRGDIGGIINADDEIAYYAMDYDAWGNVTYTLAEGLTTAQEAEALHIQEINNFTYRGYFYDRETNLYYLQSRYYDPEIGRFINADDTNYIAFDETPTSLNIFAYCGNNSVNNIDAEGSYYTTIAKNASIKSMVDSAKRLSINSGMIVLRYITVSNYVKGKGFVTQKQYQNYYQNYTSQYGGKILSLRYREQYIVKYQDVFFVTLTANQWGSYLNRLHAKYINKNSNRAWKWIKKHTNLTDRDINAWKQFLQDTADFIDFSGTDNQFLFWASYSIKLITIVAACIKWLFESNQPKIEEYIKNTISSYLTSKKGNTRIMLLMRVETFTQDYAGWHKKTRYPY